MTMAAYRTVRFSKVRRSKKENNESDREVPESLVGKGMRSVGNGIKSAGKILSYEMNRAGRNIYANTGSKLPGKVVKGIGSAAKIPTEVLGDKINSGGEYVDKLSDNPGETLKNTGKFVLTHPDEAVMNVVGTGMMMSAPVIPIPGMMEAGAFLPDIYRKSKNKLLGRDKKSKNKKHKVNK